ncbi:Uncharacterised protein [BD1-7 clade bacterium]|uniref:Uncharacterized protein n=1 Tax=BD1-7 clade bacterium TaxID=2029982 RepID=A0A5S9N229_9GAMM|nr:Uncharacterised protein [BD1-7 clade bacterium]CAA0083065.1 Uncharacterised protein [BD1-7 clade bacterium]CAA0116765.1 Uncharacterised protein [BD1-7 clade bacterium]
MATAYFINATPTKTKVQLNTGNLNSLAPMSVDSSSEAVSAPAWGADIAAFVSPDTFAGDNKVNELLYSSQQSGKTRRYKITSSVSTTLDLYFFLFEDTIVAEDQTGSSASIHIEHIETMESELA